MSSQTDIPRKSIYRLSIYQRCLERLRENGLETVASNALAKAAGVKSTQLRKDLAHFGQFGTRGLGYNVEALIVSNTTDKNRESLSNINKLEKGGLSGKPLEKRSNELINKFYKILKNKIKIIGVGGVDSGQSAYQKIISGASLVQLYTGMIYQGPSIASKISEELINILDKEGVKNISDIVGSKN